MNDWNDATEWEVEFQYGMAPNRVRVAKECDHWPMISAPRKVEEEMWTSQPHSVELPKGMFRADDCRWLTASPLPTMSTPGTESAKPAQGPRLPQPQGTPTFEGV